MNSQQREDRLLVSNQTSFFGGMNLAKTDSIGEDEYGEAFNIFNRYGVLESIKDAKELAIGVVGKKQGLYSVGPNLILFCAGRAYYKTSNVNIFSQVVGFQMSADVDRLYAQIVPASTVNLQRRLSGTDNDNLNISLQAAAVSGTPSCVVVQDGINQPQIIYVNATTFAVESRPCYNYEAWSNEVDGSSKLTGIREYVPIGTLMMFLDGILFLISKDRKRIYRSVTGRPLDFMVNVDSNGDKEDLEVDGGADTVYYAVDNANITGIFPLSTNEFLVSTDAPATYIVVIDRDNTIFNEPRFTNRPLFSSSIVNQFSFTNIVGGDSLFITGNGIVSFNASRELNVESNSSVFSQKIDAAFERILQSEEVNAVINFDGRVYFSVRTVYGNLIAVYDTHIKAWSCFISLAGVTIKQFAHTVPFSNTLYGIGSDNKIYQFFSSIENLPPVVFTRKVTTNIARIEQKISNVSCVINNTLVDGTILVTGYVDGNNCGTIEKAIRYKPIASVGDMVSYDVSTSNEEVENVNFQFVTKPLVGWKIGYKITWSGGGRLSQILHESIKNQLSQSINHSANIG